MGSDTYQSGTCRVCGAYGMVRHKNLYVSGSEGLWICIDCEKDILNYVRSLMISAEYRRKAKFKRKKSIGRLCEQADDLPF